MSLVFVGSNPGVIGKNPERKNDLQKECIDLAVRRGVCLEVSVESE